MASPKLKKPRDPRIVTREDHDLIQQRINPQEGEDYAVTVAKGKGYWVKSIHVFSRHPTQGEINAYEQTASRVKFRGQKAEIEGSQINAAVGLYDLLITRAYDVLAGLRRHEQLDREGARAKVPALTKREAIRELIGEVYSATRMEESLGGDVETDDDDSEEHTFPEPPASEQ